MIGKSLRKGRGRLSWWLAGVALGLTAGPVHAQVTAADPAAAGAVVAADSLTTAAPAPGPIFDPKVVQAGCSGCGGGAGSLCGPGELGSGGCGTCCLTGRNYCCSDCGDCKTWVGKFFCGLYQCICCSDPCYDPCWLPVADTAFFLDAARPQTFTALRYTNLIDFRNPDRAEFLMPRFRTNPNQLEPAGLCAERGFGKGPGCIASSVDIQQLSLYMEAASGAAGVSLEIPYKHLDPQTAPASRNLVPSVVRGPDGNPAEVPVTPDPFRGMPFLVPAGAGPLPHDLILGPGGATVPPLPGQANPTTLAGGTRIPRGTVLAPGTQIAPGATFVRPQVALVPQASPCCPQSGFGDLILGTKAMFLDCELLQLTFGFKTFMPTGSFVQGLGTGHVSLEPSLLYNLHLARDVYLQGQFAYWIPIGGDNLYQGNIFHAHAALNTVLWRPCPGVVLTGTLEGSLWNICNGAFTDPVLRLNGVDAAGQPVMDAPVSREAEDIFVYLGPGARLFICEKIDLGVGYQRALTKEHFARHALRAEFRWRF